MRCFGLAVVRVGFVRFHVQSASYAISYVCSVNVRICQALGNHGFSSTLGDVPRESAGVEALPGPEDRDGRAGRDSARDAPQPTHANHVQGKGVKDNRWS